MEKPKQRSSFRLKCGFAWYGLKRHLLWLTMNRYFAKEKGPLLPYVISEHQTILLRELKDVDMRLQYNKIINLKIACRQLDGIVVQPHEVLSYWKMIGKPTKDKGYVNGMILQGGTFIEGMGGGLCQLSNLIYWLTLHTPLKVVERHRHDYDVFPDSKRTQPFGSGATCFYPHGDLMIRNETPFAYQLHVWIDETYLHGEWRCVQPHPYHYEIIERNHYIQTESWGKASRHNELYRLTYDEKDQLILDEFIVRNDAMMMYSPFLANQEKHDYIK